jgi:hypothetical protein
LMAWAPSITAFSPDPHTLLIVSAATSSESPPRSAACRAGSLARAGREDLPHDALLDRVRRDARAAHGLANDLRAQRRCGKRSQRSQETARSAGGRLTQSRRFACVRS